MKNLITPLCTVLLASLPAASETIGPVTVTATPTSATLVTGGGPLFGWLNVGGSPVGLGSAFHGFPVLDDGFSNPEAGTVIALHFAPGTLVNGPGTDVAVFDARYDFGAYTLSADATGFAVELPLPEFDFVDTGETREYVYEISGAPLAAGIHVAEVDLTLLGVPAGAAVSTLHLKAINSHCDPVGVGSLTPQPGIQTLAGLEIHAAPVDATLVSGGGTAFGAVNTVDEDLSLAEALSGIPIGDSGFANLDAGTVIELTFEKGALLNGPGDDLILLDARFDEGSLAVSVDTDGFAAEASLGVADFAFSGEEREYFFFASPLSTGSHDADLHYATVDLADLGVPTDAVVERVRVRALNDGSDLVGVGSLHAAFRADLASISLAAGGTLTMTLDPGASHAGKVYLVLGTMSGTSPGFPLGSLHVPLNIDGYFSFTLANPGTGPLVDTFGLLDASGHATAMVVLPPGTMASLAGTTVNHAFGLLTPGLGPDFVSNPIATLLAP